MEQRIKNLMEFCQGMHHKDTVKELYQKYLEDIQSVTPQDIMLVQYEQLKMGLTPKEVLGFVDRLINVFQKPLSQYSWKRPEAGTFLYYLIQENRELIKKLEEFKPVIKQNDLMRQRDDVKVFVGQLTEYNEHLLKLENILFPYMEKRMERFQGLKIMWSLHDEVRKQWKELISLLEEKDPDGNTLNEEIGKFYFNLYGLVQKQELILFPCAAELLYEDDFAEMQRQSFDYSFPFIDPPQLLAGSDEKLDIASGMKTDGLQKLFTTDTGGLDFDQLSLLLNSLPVDLTYVDERDKVAWFSKPKDRVFPRSAAIIGRDVRNCHPPESVHVVEAILESFKTGEKDEAEFWIQMRGKFIHIRYVALRDMKGNYRGTLEITQEISALRALKGEKRLLDW